MLLRCITCRGKRTLGPRNKTCGALPTLPQVQHPYYTVQICQFVDYFYMPLWSIFTTVQINEIEPTRPNPAVFPKIRNMEIATTT